MSSDTFYIKEGSHFKLWISVKDNIAFEAELINEGIPFHTDENQTTLGSDIRYFLPDEYKEQVDVVLKRISVAASTDTIRMYDPKISRKVNKMYLAVVIVVVLSVAIVVIIFDK